MDDSSDQSTPDSRTLCAEFCDAINAAEFSEYRAALEAWEQLDKRYKTIFHSDSDLMDEVKNRVTRGLDITKQISELRWRFRERALLATESSRVASRSAKALHAISERLQKLVSDE
jgi:hypothetical protein